MHDESSRSGDFVVQTDGESIVQTILPAGRFTHAISSKQNGTLRSPVLPAGKKYISFQVLGQRSSAVRLVSNNCQLNYANYRALTSAELQWVTFSPPEDRESLRTYAELMTMFDNPKFPDQLSPLGGDTANYKMPWDKAAENPRSYFGVTQVVLHDGPETPRVPVSHLHEVYSSSVALAGTPSGSAPTTPQRVDDAIAIFDGVVARCATRMAAAIDAWSDDRATDDDVRWLDAMVRRELIGNKTAQTPRCVSIVQEYRKLDAELSVPRVAVGIADGGPGIEQPVFLRGDCARPGELVPRRYLEVLSMIDNPKAGRPSTESATGIRIPDTTTETNKSTALVQAAFTSTGSGRLELANRIANATNPLTSRVMVNRIWHHLFGTGLVRTVDDFGHVGELPSHPELLDHLASQFVADGWSVKRMIRSLVLTQTFQSSNRPSASVA